MIDADLRRRRLAILEEHFASEVDHEFDRTIATFAGTPRYEIVPTVAVFSFDGDRITNERVYLDLATLLRQIGRTDLFAVLAAEPETTV